VGSQGFPPREGLAALDEDTVWCEESCISFVVSGVQGPGVPGHQVLDCQPVISRRGKNHVSAPCN
jgi:hypothetical protein